MVTVGCDVGYIMRTDLRSKLPTCAPMLTETPENQLNVNGLKGLLVSDIIVVIILVVLKKSINVHVIATYLTHALFLSFKFFPLSTESSTIWLIRCLDCVKECPRLYFFYE